MVKLLILAAVIAYGWKLVSGRWPWEPKSSAGAQQTAQARRLLGVSAAALDFGSHGQRPLTSFHP